MSDVERLATRPAAGIGSEGNRLRLRTLVMIRWVALGGQAVALAVVDFGFGFELPLISAMAVVLLSGLLNVWISMTRPSSAWLGDREAAATLAFDLIQLSALLGLTGGLHNPFVIFILAPVAVSAWILSRRVTLGLAGLAATLVSAVGLWSLPLPWPQGGILASPIYLAGLWVALVLAVFFIALYVSSIAHESRDRLRALEAMQVALAREQQLSALGGLAAAAAHELGSPLGTIAVVARELNRDLPADSPWREDVELLLAEAHRCREILRALGERPESDAGAPYHRLPITTLIELAAEPHQRAEVTFALIAEPLEEQGESPPMVERNPETLHGLGVLIQNAVQFARKRVEARLWWDADDVVLRITDDGPGFDPGTLDRLGEPYFSTDAGDRRQATAGPHMGLGIFIAQTLLSRCGADLNFANRGLGGAEVTVSWPRHRLEATTVGGTA